MKNNNEIIINNYNEKIVFEKYIESRIDNESPHNKSIKELLLNLVGDYTEKSILDLGCGIGIFSKEFSGLAENILGIDISEKCIDYAQKNNNASNIEYKVMDINNLNMLDKKFDIVFSDMVFNYVEDYNKLISNIYNLLNDDGIVVFSQVHPISTASIGESSWVKENDRLRFQLDNYSNVSKRYRKYFKADLWVYWCRY